MSDNRGCRNQSVEALPVATLPFVTLRPSERPHYWNVPPVVEVVRDYPEAQAIGEQYALQFIRWLQANPQLVGMGVLGWIAADIDFQDDKRLGYWVGFFSCLEGFLFDARTAS